MNGDLWLGGCRFSPYLAWLCGDGRGSLGPPVGRKELGQALWPQKLMMWRLLEGPDSARGAGSPPHQFLPTSCPWG